MPDGQVTAGESRWACARVTVALSSLQSLRVSAQMAAVPLVSAELLGELKNEFAVQLELYLSSPAASALSAPTREKIAEAVKTMSESVLARLGPHVRAKDAPSQPVDAALLANVRALTLELHTLARKAHRYSESIPAKVTSTTRAGLRHAAGVIEAPLLVRPNLEAGVALSHQDVASFMVQFEQITDAVASLSADTGLAVERARNLLAVVRSQLDGAAPPRADETAPPPSATKRRGLVRRTPTRAASAAVRQAEPLARATRRRGRSGFEI